jgi:hypothetical protein
VHPDILNKPGKLTDEEWEIVKQHPIEGAKLAAPLSEWLGAWANSIVEHHERYDGAGYPFGLAGEEISYGGRIVAVADSYDTMTTVRSYKKVMSPQAARRELAVCAGSHFDPHVVRAFLDGSVGRLRLIRGPLAWIGSVPFVNGLAGLTRLGVVAGRVGVAGSAALAGVGTAGAFHAQPRQPPGANPTQVALPVSGSDPVIPAGLDVLHLGVVPAGSVTTLPPSGRRRAPGAPTGVSALAGDSRATVLWTAPDDGGSPITSYTVTPYVGGVAQGPQTFATADTTEVVTGLTNGTTYTFTVIATNAVGSGPESGPSDPVYLP